MTAVIDRLCEGGEHRVYRLQVDSRDVVDHDNTNPWSYRVDLPHAIEGVRTIRLLNYSMGISSAFVVIRRSKWMVSGTPPDTMAIECGANPLSTTSMRYQFDNKTNTAAFMYNAAGTVALDVFDCFNEDEIRNDGSEDFRTYSVFVCTGTLATSDTDLWYLNNRSSTQRAQPMIMTDLVGGTSDDAASYSATTPGTSTIFTTTQHTDLFMMLKVNGTPLQRIGGASATAYPKWASYRVYRPGDTISRSATLRYECRIRHLSLTFSVDLAALKWVLIPVDTVTPPAVEGAFYVIRPTGDNQVVVENTFSRGTVVYETMPTTISSIEVEWLNGTGTQILWPSTHAIEYTADEVETAKRVFHNHSFSIEMEHFTRN
jgi:hypothetical protein